MEDAPDTWLRSLVRLTGADALRMRAIIVSAEAHYRRRIAAARSEGRVDDVKGLQAERDCMVEYLEEQLHVIRTLRTERRARRRFVDLPDRPAQGEDNEFWARANFDTQYILTPRGFSVVEERFLARRKLKLETWVPLVTALTALGGIAVALAALLVKR